MTLRWSTLIISSVCKGSHPVSAQPPRPNSLLQSVVRPNHQRQMSRCSPVTEQRLNPVPIRPLPAKHVQLFNQVVNNDEIEFIKKLFHGAGHEIRIAGGAVRDLLSGKVPHDIDFATTATPEESKALLEGLSNVRLILTKAGERHGTVAARINEKQVFEITTLRCDVISDGRHAQVEFVKDWKIDAQRRDLTFNSMFLTLDGTLVDFYNGAQDLEQGVVRFVGDASTRIEEDYLRILRYFRFWSRYGQQRPDEYTMKVLNDHINDSGLDSISGERIWTEMQRIFEKIPCHRVVELMLELKLFHRLKVYHDDLDKSGDDDNRSGADKYASYTKKVIEDLKIVQNNLCGLNVFKFKTTNASLSEFLPIVPFATLIRSHSQFESAYARMKWSNLQREFVLYVLANRDRVGIDLKVCKIQLALEPSSKRSLLLDMMIEYMKYTGHLELIDDLYSWKVPDFPLRTADIVHTIPPPKRNISKLLTALKKEWAASDFKVTQSDLMISLERMIQNMKESK